MAISRQEYWSVGHALLQGVILTQGLNLRLLCLLHWQEGSLALVQPGKPTDDETPVKQPCPLPVGGERGLLAPFFDPRINLSIVSEPNVASFYWLQRH